MGDDVYLLVRRNPDTGDLERVRFDRGILARMDVTENEWRVFAAASLDEQFD